MYSDSSLFSETKKQVKTLSGTLQVTRSGVGFLLQEGELEDIFIGPSNLGKALNGDMVEVRLRGRSKRSGRPEGEVVKVLQRSQTQFVGNSGSQKLVYHGKPLICVFIKK